MVATLDLVLILSGWLCAVIAVILLVREKLQNKAMRAEMEKHNKTEKNKKLVIPDDIKDEDVVKGVIEFLDAFWNNEHMKRRAEEVHKKLSDALKKWDEEE
jgi:hypothetical protein